MWLSCAATLLEKPPVDAEGGAAERLSGVLPILGAAEGIIFANGSRSWDSARLLTGVLMVLEEVAIAVCAGAATCDISGAAFSSFPRRIFPLF